MTKQVFVSSDLDLRTNQWRKREPKRCLCCNAPAVFTDIDSNRALVMSCDECLAIEVVTKSATSWWYHGARPAENWPSAFLISLQERS